MNSRNLLIAIVISGASIVSHASAGTITFLGYIAQETCKIDLQQNTVNANCPKTHQTHQYNIHTAQQHRLPLSQADMKMTWLDAAHQKGIVTVTYR